MSKSSSQYEESGVSGTGAEKALSGLLKNILPTHQFNKQFPVKADIGYFANVIEFGNGRGVAFCTDGVGTKMIVAEMMNQYDTIGIDCVAMNVNDLICLGAQPVSMVDYIACSHTDPKVFEELGQGLAEGARQANISISGGEISQIREIIQGIDLTAAAIGHIELEKINTGQNIQTGDLILGLASSGIHSNGLTLARQSLLGTSLEEQKSNINQFEPTFNRTLGAELLEPTRIYVQPILEMLNENINLKAMVHITGGGLENLLRVKSESIRFVVDSPLDVPPVFQKIQQNSAVSDAEMYEVFNMGVGFVVIVSHANEAQKVQEICKNYEISCHGIGYVEESQQKEIVLPQQNLISSGAGFKNFID